MVDTAYFLEILLRGATMGMLLLGTSLFLRQGRGFGVERLAALFSFGTAAYVVISSPAISPHTGVLLYPLVFLATFNSVFFWWLATALFDDDFRWRPWRFIPFVLIGILYLLRRISAELVSGPADNILQQMLIIAMTLHALWLALSHRNDDLLEQRRRFRVVFAFIIGMTGLIIAVIEIALNEQIAPKWLTTLHACLVFGLSYAFFYWILRITHVFNTRHPDEKREKFDMPPEDQVELERVRAAMDTGIYKREGLTIRSLSEVLKIPEHRLRRLINQQLGFNNFSAFLNHYRIRDAVKILEDPHHARRQIIQIAFDMGYGSIAPFNRAFKATHNVTPTTYRKLALENQT